MGKQHASSLTRSGSCARAEVAQSTVIGSVLRILVQLYRWGVSPMLPRACRFHPSCSQFALEALAEHGTVEGLRLTLRRLARCHPWNPGGYDPVSPRKA